jgi:hypothetical protein
VVEEENGDLYHTETEGIDDLNYPAYLKYRLVLSWKRAERRDTRKNFSRFPGLTFQMC